MRRESKGVLRVLQGSFPKLLFALGLIALVLIGGTYNGSVVFAGQKLFPTVVETRYGKVAGFYNADNTVAWTGVPFAKPPVGDLRWKAPQDPDPWNGELDASQDCVPCTQLYTLPNWIRLNFAIGSEDCLYLSIYRPSTAAKNLPVYVYIHGGSNNFGTANDYDGSVIASKSNTVVVVVQYRLGPLGWFSHPALRHGESQLDDSGNFGTLDNIKALEWIQENIEVFGGDPDKVTITGESAGAHNVMNLVISPLAAGLFHRAMSQSGGMITRTVDVGEALANSTIEKLLTLYGDTWADWESWSLEEQEAYLRAADAKDLYEILYGSIGTYDAYQDGVVIPSSVVSTIRSGNYNKVPIIVGANQYETKAFLPLYGPYFGVPWWDLRFEVLEGNQSLDDVLRTDFDKALYEVTGYYGSRNWRAKFVDERARALKEQQERVYAYQFNWGGPGSGPSPFDFIYGAGHAMEIAFFFGSDTSLWGYGYNPGNDTAGRQALSDAMMAYLANFAKTGNPNGSGLPVWQKWYNKEGKSKLMVFDANFDEALLNMSDEEVTFAGVAAELSAAISTWDPAYQVAWGWLPWSFQWETPE